VNHSTVTIVLVALGVLLLAWVVWPRRTHSIRGTAAELEARIVRLMQSGDQTLLIVQVPGTKDFLQLTATSDSAQIDFPLITERQRALEPKIREAARELRLDFRETLGSEGSRFLDCDFAGTSQQIAGACRILLTRVFGISEDAPLVFESDGNI
jgi:hypothetical protein